MWSKYQKSTPTLPKKASSSEINYWIQTGLEVIIREGILFVSFDIHTKNNLMSADQTRKNKQFGKNKKDDRGNKEPAGKPSETDQSLHKPYRGDDEEKINRTDYSQQIGEFSDWRKGHESATV